MNPEAQRQRTISMYIVVWAKQAQNGDEISNIHELNSLIQNGWTPVREVPIGAGQSGVCRALVLLHKAN